MASVWVCAPALGLRLRLFQGFSAAEELLHELERTTGVCDLYVVCNGRVVDREQPLQDGSVYHLEPRLRGGKGGFGSMLRALGAQIEKTTNREACRDLSGRRLRDVNHEKEMAEWLKKQAEREAEKEQRRLERLQKKLAEPKHNFTDSKYTRQCHELSERLEDSVIKGLQASSSSVVRPEASKRQSEDRAGPKIKKSRSSAPFTWTGLDLSDDEEQDQDSDSESDSDPSGGPEGAGPGPSGGPEGAGPGPSGGPERSGPGPSGGPEGAGPGPSGGPEGSCPSGSELSPPALSEDRSSGTSPGSRPSPGPEEESSCRPDQDQDQAQAQSSCRPDQDQAQSSCRPDQDQAQSSCRPDQDQAQSSCRPDQDQAQSSCRPDQHQAQSSCRPDQDHNPDQRPLLDLDSVSCSEDLEALGLNVLKEELMKRGLKCGGTLSERAARLFSVRGKREDEVDPALLAKNKKKK